MCTAPCFILSSAGKQQCLHYLDYPHKLLASMMVWIKASWLGAMVMGVLFPISILLNIQNFTIQNGLPNHQLIHWAESHMCSTLFCYSLFSRFAAMAAPLRNLASMKVKDVPTYVKTSLTREKVMNNTWSWLYKYNEKYIQTGSIRPLTDVMLSVGFLSYAVGWPTEIRHLRHAEEAAKHGKEHH